jgi:hypothetical protein
MEEKYLRKKEHSKGARNCFKRERGIHRVAESMSDPSFVSLQIEQLNRKKNARLLAVFFFQINGTGEDEAIHSTDFG